VACLKAKNLQRDFEIKWTLWWAFVSAQGHPARSISFVLDDR
jgi:hypothetical protein